MLPSLRVRDWPDFAHRGFMLDVSRNKVPTLATLRSLIDRLAELKFNQLQLYMEHTFAYRGHAAVWRGASPLHGHEIRRLGAYCRERFIELVPNQNSFGHFHRWLIHEPYRHLAECPEGFVHPFSPDPKPFSLSPVDPGSLELLRDLYDQLLPHFESRLFNVGLDEAFDLGAGRSADLCRRHGKERVYLDFLRRVHGLVGERGRRMLFWGDIILRRPELIAELPGDAVALEWGYEADHPFAEDCRRFAESGIEFWVCPGTSAWNSFAGRVNNALANLASAAVYGREQGARGYLITDWGDHGHLQPLPVTWPGLVAGSGYAWNAGTARDAHAGAGRPDLAGLLDLHVFRDRNRVTGGVSIGLGDTYPRERRGRGSERLGPVLPADVRRQAGSGAPLPGDDGGPSGEGPGLSRPGHGSFGGRPHRGRRSGPCRTRLGGGSAARLLPTGEGVARSRLRSSAGQPVRVPPPAAGAGARRIDREVARHLAGPQPARGGSRARSPGCGANVICCFEGRPAEGL